MAANRVAPGKGLSVRFVGQSHGVQTTLDLILRYCGVPKGEISYRCGGINHMYWSFSLEHKGRDLYPTLRALFEWPECIKNEKVRGEVFRHVGSCISESRGQLSEYVPWFRKTKAALETCCDEPSFGGETTAYHSWCRTVADYYMPHDPLRYESTALELRRVDYCSWIYGDRGDEPIISILGPPAQRRVHYEFTWRVLRGGADIHR